MLPLVERVGDERGAAHAAAIGSRKTPRRTETKRLGNPRKPPLKLCLLLGRRALFVVRVVFHLRAFFWHVELRLALVHG